MYLFTLEGRTSTMQIPDLINYSKITTKLTKYSDFYYFINVNFHKKGNGLFT